jgi:hypothetical protein
MSDTPAVNQPDSGTYGEKADVARLQSALPKGAIGQPAAPQQPPALSPAPVRPNPGMDGRPQTGAAVPPGIPSALLTPGADNFNAPVAPTSQPAPQTRPQQTLFTLDLLSRSPDVSSATREWAKHVLTVLLGNG